MHFIYNAAFLIAGYKWGDWNNWKLYYPTILFFILGDLLKNFLLHHHPMWTYEETIFGQQILMNHTFISLMIMIIVYPATVLIYLGRFPKTKGKGVLWILLWIFLYTFVEYINKQFLSLIHHQNGWHIGWSILFNFVMFSMLKLHYKNPLLALAVSGLWILFLWNVFKVPFENMR